eukprot:TRINITY_DN61937_c0_g1_i1.p2 TRINITY_DN61937_c0_g1~~TRINITY_DN61937_c0_g1_i1.p2  ORF type:complete len:115 (-),score=16.03 TRINITY_DN61937_c0_g1_i1:78-422(-)
MKRRPPRSTLSSSSAASDVYKRQVFRLFLFFQPSPFPSHHVVVVRGMHSLLGEGKGEPPPCVCRRDILSLLFSHALRFLCMCGSNAVSYTHLRAHETPEHLVCRLLLEKKKYKL